MKKILVPLLFILALAACVDEQPRQVRDGVEYAGGGFRGRWWNYYERGCSLAEGKFFQEAIADFEEAVKGRGQDQWRARTYGMHFIDYFPHRELGIVSYRLGDLERAIRELENSIAGDPSAKAHFFLNKARAAKLKKEGLDRAAPRLSAAFLGKDAVTRGFSAVVEVRASDDTFVSTCDVGEHRVPIELARPEWSTELEVPLVEGVNDFEVRVGDLSGKESTRTISILSDHQGPLVLVEEFRADGGQVRLKLSVSDAGGLAALAINGQAQTVSGHPLAHAADLRLPWGAVEIRATDRAGNQTEARLGSGEIDPAPGQGPRTAALALPNGVVADLPGSPLLAAAGADTEPPRIELNNLVATQETFEEQVLFEGMVADLSSVSLLAINQEPILEKNGKKLFFTLLKKLAEGANEFNILARDSAGNESEQRVEVICKVQEVRKIGSRMSIGLLPFEKKGEPSTLGDVIYEKLIDSFIEQRRFKIVERQRLDAVLQEQRLAASDLTDPNQAVKLGKIIAAHAILAGSIIETPDAVEVIGRLIDVESSAILVSNDVYDQGKTLKTLDNLLDSLAFKFKRDFPLAEGLVIDVKGGGAMVDVGLETNLREYTRLIAYRESGGVKHPVTGRLLGVEEKEIGELKITTVHKEFSNAEILSGGEELKVLDKVIAR